jgi:hypothetical protein
MKVFVSGEPFNIVTDLARHYANNQNKTATEYDIFNRVYLHIRENY